MGKDRLEAFSDGVIATARPCVFTLPDEWSPIAQDDEAVLYYARGHSADRSRARAGTQAVSTGDLLDETSGHRIVSRVHVVGPLAAHITLHHFACRDLAASGRACAAILGTVRRDRAEA